MKEWTMFEDVPFPKDGACPNCGNKEFLEGPSGGVCTNVQCTKCGIRWNANSVGFPWQFIGTKEDE